MKRALLLSLLTCLSLASVIGLCEGQLVWIPVLLVSILLFIPVAGRFR